MTDKRFLLIKITEFEFMGGATETEHKPIGMFATGDEAKAKAKELGIGFWDYEIFELKDDGTFEEW